MTFGTNFKPAPGDAKRARYKKKVARRTVRDKAARTHQREQAVAWTQVRAAVYLRDHGRCRACDTLVELMSSNPFKEAQMHHLVYRSAGGTDAPSNVIALCAACHAEEHEHTLTIEGTADGAVTFASIHPTTRAVERRWESPCRP